MPSVIHYVGINDTRIKNGNQPDKTGKERKGKEDSNVFADLLV